MTAYEIGLTTEDFWKCDPFLFYEMVEFYVRKEANK